MDDKWTWLQNYLIEVLSESEEDPENDRCVDAQDILNYMAELEAWPWTRTS